MRTMRLLAILWLVGSWAVGAQAAVSALDDEGRTVTLPAPARRIVSVAPHATELLFAAGAGAQVVATVRYGDYPDAAKRLPVVGDANQLDLERIAALKPDLIVVWAHGNSAAQLDRLRALKLPLFHSEPRDLAQIGESLRRLGTLAGTRAAADTAADAYAAELAALRRQYAARPPLRVFYQVWHQPLLTINDRHPIADMIRGCGGVNVFGAEPLLVPTVSPEAVLAARPQVLASSSVETRDDETLSPWRGLARFEPVARQAVVMVPADLISRASPRALQAMRLLCEGFEQVRARR
ncbi:ABC transporter substrate-binding protein [Ideonella sp. 4Y11]|uniref:ABC transporter substrate-binding protein n=2 Tax=Ideonella aquatica TaxID=2824119 RepID=A0A941BJX5_9BURK|nr:ABC transporter substrate-binding protein [Ideonella aquatica]